MLIFDIFKNASRNCQAKYWSQHMRYIYYVWIMLSDEKSGIVPRDRGDWWSSSRWATSGRVCGQASTPSPRTASRHLSAHTACTSLDSRQHTSYYTTQHIHVVHTSPDFIINTPSLPTRYNVLAKKRANVPMQYLFKCTCIRLASEDMHITNAIETAAAIIYNWNQSTEPAHTHT